MAIGLAVHAVAWLAVCWACRENRASIILTRDVEWVDDNDDDEPRQRRFKRYLLPLGLIAIAIGLLTVCS